MKSIVSTLILLLLLPATHAAPGIRRLNSVESDRHHFRNIMHNHSLTDPQKFYQIALSCTAVTDKVSGVPYVGKKDAINNTHRYQEMYGTFMLPYVRRHHLLKKPMKFFEIGLGCDMNYGVCIEIFA